MTDDERLAILGRYADGAITAEHAADLLGPYVSVSEIVIETARRCGRLPDPHSPFTEGEFHRALVMLGLEPGGGVSSRSQR